MPIEDRDWYKGEHPPTCSCADCTRKRLGKSGKDEDKPKPKNNKPDIFEKVIFNKEPLSENQNNLPPKTENTPVQSSDLHNVVDNQKHATTRSGSNYTKTVKHNTPKYLIALLLMFSLSITGLGISIFVESFIPFWLLFGFSLIFSIEKWFKGITYKHKGIGGLYRLFLNLSILSIFGLIIWTGIRLFSQQFVSNQLIGSLIFLGEFVFFIWMCKVVSKNSQRRPSMKLTIFSIICLFLVFAFAGVQPMASYKDNAINFIGSIYQSGSTAEIAKPTITQAPTSIPKPTVTSQPFPAPSSTPTPVKNLGVDGKTGTYKNYYLGLVRDGGAIINSYGNFVVLINNRDAKNPTYAELLNFLKSDKTDDFPYKYVDTAAGSYYGAAEDKVDLSLIKNIIDGTTQPDSPRICSDFAESLHNNAEKAGIRCAYVSLDMIGYTDPYNLGIASDAGHACNAFQTSDRGLVYIDCTGNNDNQGPPNNDMIVTVEKGKQYIPQFVFPSGG